MTRLAIVAGAAAILVATGTFLLLRPAANVGPTPSSSAPPSAPPSRAPGESGAVGPLDDVLRATWLAFANSSEVLGTGSGPVTLRVSSVGTGIDATNFGPGHGYASTASQIGPSKIELVLDRAGGGCAAGARGVYGWSLSDDRSELTIFNVSDECENRSRVFQRVWVRSLADATTVGAGVVTTIDPNFAVTMPDDAYEPRTTLKDFVEIPGTNGSLMVFKNPQPFVDACSTDEARVPYQPGAAAFIETFRNNDAFDVSEATPLTIGGHDALKVTIGGKAAYARCPGQELYEYTPKECNCHFIVGQGDADAMYLVDVGADTFMFIVSPFGNPAEQQIIDSIRIPVDLPVQ